MKKNNKGKGIVWLFLFLAAFSGSFVSFFPLVEVKLPGIAEKVNSFRGYYTGPLFTNPEGDSEDYFTTKFSGIKSYMEKGQIFYFIPAANIDFIISSFYEGASKKLMEIYLLEAEDMNTIIGTNINVPYATGRQAGAFSQQGEEMPEHANWFNYECKKGIKYALRVIPKSKQDIGDTFVLSMEANEGWISLMGLWGMFVSLLIVLYLLNIVIRIVLWARK